VRAWFEFLSSVRKIARMEPGEFEGALRLVLQEYCD
jgi:hypothetical protein